MMPSSVCVHMRTHTHASSEVFIRALHAPALATHQETFWLVYNHSICWQMVVIQKTELNQRCRCNALLSYKAHRVVVGLGQLLSLSSIYFTALL